ALGSVACAALRYHTADTMSHGLAALCFTGALAAALAADLEARAGRARALDVAAGFALGWPPATPPASPPPPAGAPRVRPGRAAGRAAAALRMAAGALPGLALLVLHQRAATGAFGASSQALYYAASDGPPGCFRFGFGDGIGCLGEHGEFVRARLEHGFGAL